MITLTKLPEGYVPYERLTVCSNTITDGAHILLVGDVPPLLIGAAEIPMVWLLAPTDQSGTSFVQVVARSVATHPAASVTSDASGLSICLGGELALHVHPVSRAEAVVDFLDLRQLGMDMHGDSKSLIAGDAVLTRNSFNGAKSMISSVAAHRPAQSMQPV